MMDFVIGPAHGLHPQHAGPGQLEAALTLAPASLIWKGSAMRIIKSPHAEKVILYATQTRPIAQIKPSAKRNGVNGEALYWIPAGGVDQTTGQQVDVVLFSTAPVPVRALDVLDVDDLQLLEVVGGRNLFGIYQTDHVRIAGNLLDVWDSSTAMTEADHE